MRSLCIIVPRRKAEEIRRRLVSRDLLEKNLKIVRDGDIVAIPVREEVDLGHPVEEREFEEAFRPIADYREITVVPDELRRLLPTALDIVGDVALVRLPAELLAHGGEIGDGILRAHRHLRCVFADEGVAGEYRIRRVSHLAGEDRTRTIHREHGMNLLVDVARAYFSPRLATERFRVAGQVRPGEVVLDLFTGVGPYAILIAKTRSPEIVHAVDNNPDAIELLEVNVRRNRVESVRPILGDAHEAMRAIGQVDHLIMDLPRSADEFYIDALRCVKNGGTMHYYEMLERADFERRGDDLVVIAGREGIGVKVISTREVRTYSPTQHHYAFDLRVSRG